MMLVDPRRIRHASLVSNLHVYASMLGQSLAEFQKTRNAPGALYSVAGAAGSAPRQGTPAA